MIDLFLDSSPRLLAEIKSGADRRDSQAVERAAHALKGALQNLSALPCARAALELEKLARAGEMESIDDALIDLKDNMDRLLVELAQWSKGVCA